MILGIRRKIYVNPAKYNFWAGEEFWKYDTAREGLIAKYGDGKHREFFYELARRKREEENEEIRNEEIRRMQREVQDIKRRIEQD